MRLPVRCADFSRRACSFSELWPDSAIPVRSPFTSAINTGTPISEKDSASFCRVTVLPVPVAPVIKPWRLAIAGSKCSCLSSVRAISRGELMSDFSIYPAASIGNLIAKEGNHAHPRLFTSGAVALN